MFVNGKLISMFLWLSIADLSVIFIYSCMKNYILKCIVSTLLLIFPLFSPFPLSTKHVKTFKGAKQSHLKVFKLHVLQEYTMLNVPSPVKHKHIMNNLLHLCSLMFTCFHFICTYRSTVFCWCFFGAVLLLTLKKTPNNQVMAVKHCTQQLSFVLYCFMLFDISNKPNSVSTSPLHR